MGNIGKPLASLWNGTSIAAPSPPSAPRVLAHYEPQTREEAVGPNRNRLTSVCRQRRCVENLDKSLERQENRGNRWSSKDVIG